MSVVAHGPLVFCWISVYKFHTCCDGDDLLFLQGLYSAAVVLYLAYFVAAMVISHQDQVKDPTPLIVVTVVTATFITIWQIRKRFEQRILENVLFPICQAFNQRQKVLTGIKM